VFRALLAILVAAPAGALADPPDPAQGGSSGAVESAPGGAMAPTEKSAPPAAEAPATAAAPTSGEETADLASGGIRADEGRVEILGRRIPIGRRVETPEGWFRVEEAGPEDGRVGSFAVVSAASFAAFGAESEGASPGAGEAAPAPRVAAPDCRAERSAYLAELWRMSGIEDVKDPEAVIRGVGADGFAPGLGTLWLALSTDPFRPLAWSSALRDRAEELAQCERGR
jgi:hypothetical protein